MSAAKTFAAHLEGVKEVGRDRWMARCPAHEDRKASLSVKQADDRILIHCWAGCGAGDVVAALGLTLADLFDPQDRYRHAAPKRPPLPTTREFLSLVEFDLVVMECTFPEVMCGVRLNDIARATATEASRSIRRTLEVCHRAG